MFGDGRQLKNTLISAELAYLEGVHIVILYYQYSFAICRLLALLELSGNEMCVSLVLCVFGGELIEVHCYVLVQWLYLP